MFRNSGTKVSERLPQSVSKIFLRTHHSRDARRSWRRSIDHIILYVYYLALPLRLALRLPLQLPLLRLMSFFFLVLVDLVREIASRGGGAHTGHTNRCCAYDNGSAGANDCC